MASAGASGSSRTSQRPAPRNAITPAGDNQETYEKGDKPPGCDDAFAFHVGEDIQELDQSLAR